MKKTSPSTNTIEPNYNFSIYIDGSSRGNPGPASIGIVILNEKGDRIKEIKEEIGITTNNVAEYCAAIIALITVLSDVQKNKLPLSEISISIYTDSELLVRQYEGKYKIKSENIIPLSFILNDLSSKFKNVDFKHISRKENKISHQLAKDLKD